MKKKTGLIILAVLLVTSIIVAILLIHSNQQKADQYQQAVRLMDSGNPVEAYRLFKQLGNYRDSENQAARIASSDPLLVYRIAEKVDTVSFGHWEQDNNPDNGPEPIEWIVLDKIDGRLLLISSSCLAGMAYHMEPFTPVTWETCSLREWLNSIFLSSAFTEEEQAWIKTRTRLMARVSSDQGVILQ
jgi:hypothetical protein